AKPSSPVSERTKMQLAYERLSEIEAARLEALEMERFENKKAEIERQDAIYAKADNDDNFAARMVALINQRKIAFAE
ncbi:hypothetical protein Tco_0457201, partial [Tanacetum coccineum]